MDLSMDVHIHGNPAYRAVALGLSVTIWPQFAIECVRRSNQQRGGSLWA